MADKPKKASKGANDAKLRTLEAQINDLTEALQRERADATNIRRRHDEEIDNLRTNVKLHVVRDLLPVIDNLELALKHVPKELTNNDYVKGVQSIVKQFGATLEKIGVSRISTVGEKFDPELHEAISVEDGDGKDEIVSEELASGYILGDKVVRHAMVRVKS